MDSELRRLKSNLKYSGMAFIVFGFWAMVKLVVYYAQSEDYKGKFEGHPVISAVTLGILLVIDVWIHLRVGLGAVNEATDNPKRKKYLALVIIYGLFTVCSYAYYYFVPLTMSNVGELFVSLFVDISIVIASVYIVVSAIKIRRFR